MGPIAAAGVGSAGPTYSMSQLNQRTSTSAAPLGSAQQLVGGTAQSQGIIAVFDAVSQLMKDIGGGIDDDQTLRTIVMLLILLALLNDTRQSTGRSAASTLGNGSGGFQFYGSYSSTTITLEQTSTTAMFGTIDASAGSAAGSASTSGEQLDVTV